MKNILPALTISILIIFSGCSKKQDKKAISTTDISQPKKLKNLESKKVQNMTLAIVIKGLKRSLMMLLPLG